MSAAAAIAMSNRFTATHKEQEKNKHLIYSHFGCCSCHMGAVWLLDCMLHTLCRAALAAHLTYKTAVHHSKWKLKYISYNEP